MASAVGGLWPGSVRGPRVRADGCIWLRALGRAGALTAPNRRSRGRERLARSEARKFPHLARGGLASPGGKGLPGSLGFLPNAWRASASPATRGRPMFRAPHVQLHHHPMIKRPRRCVVRLTTRPAGAAPGGGGRNARLKGKDIDHSRPWDPPSPPQTARAPAGRPPNRGGRDSRQRDSANCRGSCAI